MAGGRKERLAEMAAAEAFDAPDFASAEHGAPDEPRGPLLPPDSPVTPLGVQGLKIHFLDCHNQLQSVGTECRKNDLKLWFGTDWLIRHFKQLPKGWKEGDPVTKFDQDDASTALVEDCRAKGIFNPQGKVFGRGAHRVPGAEEQLVLHMGRSVLVAGGPDGRGGKATTSRAYKAGMVRVGEREAFFPALESLPPPAKECGTVQDGKDVLALYGRWNWVEKKAAELLMLGFTMQSFVCGAMQWRSHVWVPGPTTAGKSSLQARFRALLDGWCLTTADASEAAIRQILGNDTLAVSIDEAEAHDNPERLHAVMNLIKKASSGDKILRGGADHKGQEFTAQSAFLLSSVLHAPLRAEDRNRIVLLELRQLDENAEPLEMELARWRSVGRRLHRRMIEQWPRFERTLAAYKRAIGAQRFVGRWQDTYGTLLACADLALYDHAPDEIGPYDEPGLSRVTDAVTAILPLMARGRVEARDDVERVIAHLVSHALPGAHGSPPEPVGTWIERALATRTRIDERGDETQGPDDAARAKLKSAGLRVVQLVGPEQGIAEALLDEGGWSMGYLAIAYGTHKGMAEIFARSDWAGGNWPQSLKKVPGAIGPKKVRFGGQKPDNAMLIPLSAFRGEEG